MIRFLKALALTGFASVYLMQAPCTFAGHGFSILPNFANPINILGNLFPGT